MARQSGQFTNKNLCWTLSVISARDFLSGGPGVSTGAHSSPIMQTAENPFRSFEFENVNRIGSPRSASVRGRRGHSSIESVASFAPDLSASDGSNSSLSATISIPVATPSGWDATSVSSVLIVTRQRWVPSRSEALRATAEIVSRAKSGRVPGSRLIAELTFSRTIHSPVGSKNHNQETDQNCGDREHYHHLHPRIIAIEEHSTESVRIK